jgi:periplasmic protein TonB
LPLLLAPAGPRLLLIAAAMAGIAATLCALTLCYVWADTRQQHGRTWPWLGITLLLNLPGFLIYLVYSARKTGDWKRAAIPMAYVAESMLVGVLILLPLIYTQALPRQLLIADIHIPPPPGSPPEPRAGQQARPPARHASVDPFTVPVKIPTTIEQIAETPEPPQVKGVEGPFVPGVPPGYGVGNGLVPGGLPWNTGTPPPVPPAHVAAPPRLYLVGGDVIAAHALYQPRPIYPPLAIMAHVQGTVMLQAILGKDGTVKDLKVLSGHPLLVHAALDAVKTWRYQPTLLNSEPVDVLTEIDVNFNLEE